MSAFWFGILLVGFGAYTLLRIRLGGSTVRRDLTTRLFGLASFCLGITFFARAFGAPPAFALMIGGVIGGLIGVLLMNKNMRL